MIIIGLGNKGLSYKNTYHNMGFDVVSKLAKELGVRFSHTECKANRRYERERETRRPCKTRNVYEPFRRVGQGTYGEI